MDVSFGVGGCCRDVNNVLGIYVFDVLFGNVLWF